MIRSSFLLLCFCVFLLAGCSSNEKKSVRKAYTGAPGELLVVVEDFYWEGEVGQVLQNAFLRHVPGLPQAEPMFSVQRLKPSEFRGIFQSHRNVFRVVIKDFAEAQKAELEVLRSKWATDQLVATIYADSDRSFVKLFKEKQEDIIALFNEEERTRVLGKQRIVAEPLVESKIREMFSISLSIPKGYNAVKDSSDFLWLKRDQIRNVGAVSHDANQGIYIFKQPYTDTLLFESDQLSAIRDSLTRLYIPGPLKDSYMTTEHLIAPSSREVNIQNSFAIEQRGLWKTEGAFMGGPFLTITTVDLSGKNLITVGGYVFAPKFDKREYLREVEAVLYSLRF